MYGMIHSYSFETLYLYHIPWGGHFFAGNGIGDEGFSALARAFAAGACPVLDSLNLSGEFNDPACILSGG